MTYEIFAYRPGAGDYGSDWSRIAIKAGSGAARYTAESHRAQAQEPTRVFTAPKRGVGRMVAEFGKP